MLGHTFVQFIDNIMVGQLGTLKFSNFSTQTRSKTLINYISDKETILKYSKELLYKDILIDSVRLIGISLSNLNLKTFFHI